MFVGHAAVAFALAAWVATLAGVERERALLVGLAAAGFATVPDVDVGYALVGLASATSLDPWSLVEAFWAASLVVHRGATHSLLVGGLAAIGFAAVAAGGLARIGGMAVLVGLSAVAFAAGGPLLAGVVGSFALAGVAVAVGAHRLGLPPRVVLASALVGLLTHPFGDLFTGDPPPLLYPLDVEVPSGLVLLSPDPTLHLLGAFGVELATVWLAAAVYCRLRDRPLVAHVDPRAALGAGYGAAVVVIPPPTLEVSYHFVFTVLAVGTVGAAADPPLPDLRVGTTRLRAALTGLAAVTAAWLAYGAAYVVA